MWQIEGIFYVLLFVIISLFIWGLYHIIRGAVCMGFSPEWSWCASINQPEEPEGTKDDQVK